MIVPATASSLNAIGPLPLAIVRAVDPSLSSAAARFTRHDADPTSGTSVTTALPPLPTGSATPGSHGASEPAPAKTYVPIEPVTAGREPMVNAAAGGCCGVASAEGEATAADDGAGMVGVAAGGDAPGVPDGGAAVGTHATTSTATATTTAGRARWRTAAIIEWHLQ